MIKSARKNPYAAWMYFDNFKQVARQVKQTLLDFAKLERNPPFGIQQYDDAFNKLLDRSFVLKSKHYGIKCKISFRSGGQHYASTNTGSSKISFFPDTFLKRWLNPEMILAHELQHLVETLVHMKGKNWQAYIYNPDFRNEPEGKEAKRHKKLWFEINKQEINYNLAKKKLYYNTPTEVRAFVGQIINTLTSRKNEIREQLLTRENKSNYLISLLIGILSEVDIKRLSNLTKENRVYFLKEIYKYLMS